MGFGECFVCWFPQRSCGDELAISKAIACIHDHDHRALAQACMVLEAVIKNDQIMFFRCFHGARDPVLGDQGWALRCEQ